MKSDHKKTKRRVLPVSASLIVAAALPFMLGCARHKTCTVQSVAPQTPAQVRQSNLSALKARGVQVIHLGETYRLVMQSSKVFNPDSANLTSNARGTLNLISNLLNSYHILTVRVAAYSDNVNPGIRKDALTQRQADVVESYLTNRGLDTRLIYGIGEGDKNPVAWNGSAVGRNANRRVEVSFMYLPTKTIYE